MNGVERVRRLVRIMAVNRTFLQNQSSKIPLPPTSILSCILLLVILLSIPIVSVIYGILTYKEPEITVDYVIYDPPCNGSVIFRMTIDKREYFPNEKIEIEFYIINKGNTRIVVKTPNLGFDFRIKFRRSDNFTVEFQIPEIFIPAVGEHEIPANTKILVDKFNLIAGEDIPPGNYTVDATTMLYIPRVLITLSAEIEINS